MIGSSNKNIILCILLFFLLSQFSMGFTIEDHEQQILSTRTWIVDNEGDGDFTTIQEAIDNAESGDIIQVYSGHYNEKLVVNRNSLIIEGKDYELGRGGDNGKPVIDGNGEGTVVSILGEKVTITGFIISNSGSSPEYAGIEIYDNYQTISGNIIASNANGITIHSSSKKNTILDNDIAGNINGMLLNGSRNNEISWNDIRGSSIGIKIYSSTYNIFANNTIEDNNYGVYSSLSTYNDFINNTLSNNIMGFFLNRSTITTIKENIISGNGYGIYLNYSSTGNTISDNVIENNNDVGIKIDGSSGNTLLRNILRDNSIGVKIESSTYNTLGNNELNGNNYGISLNQSSVTTITDNTITESNRGITINIGKDNIISRNTISSTLFGESILLIEASHNSVSKNTISGAGVSLYYSNDNTVSSNTIDNALNGIYFNNSCNNTITSNVISNSNFDGIYLGILCSGNAIYHNNFLNNQLNAHDKGNNTWDNGYPSGGNYWSDYSGDDSYHGPNQNQSGSDGIGDIPYLIPGDNNKDHYPLMNKWGAPEKPTTPNGQTTVKPGKTYYYSTSTTDPNGDKIQYGWDWDGDKLVDDWTRFYDSGEKITTSHVWDQQGTYTIYVKAKDIQGAESEWSDPLPVSVPINHLSIFKLLSNEYPMFKIFLLFRS